MLVFGLLGISAIDNILQPPLISPARHQSFVLTLMGVFGGVLGFGVMSVVLGPTLLVLSIDLGGQWMRRCAPASAGANAEPR